MDKPDLTEVQALFVRYANMIDERQLSRAGEVFTHDAVYDTSAFGLGRHVGLEAITECLRTVQHPLLHVPVNAEIESSSDGIVRTLSRCVAILDNGQVSQCTYRDILVRTENGWRMRERLVLTRTPADIPAPT